jgi:hypothetical protein
MGRRIKNVRKDKRIFSKTSARTHKKNLPGHNLTRGGTCL